MVPGALGTGFDFGLPDRPLPWSQRGGDAVVGGWDVFDQLCTGDRRRPHQLHQQRDPQRHAARRCQLHQQRQQDCHDLRYAHRGCWRQLPGDAHRQGHSWHDYAVFLLTVAAAPAITTAATATATVGSAFSPSPARRNAGLEYRWSARKRVDQRQPIPTALPGSQVSADGSFVG